MEDFLIFVAIGFLAQLVDGAAGMAYGVISSSLLLSFGLPPAVVSATVHAAECFSTGTSALSHKAFGNIDKKLFRSLLLPGMAGAMIGAYALSSLPGDKIKPFISAYLLVLGVIIIYKASHEFPARRVTTFMTPLGFFGAMLDAIGGGGWGPIVASNLVSRGNDIRLTVGSVNAVEFFVTVSASATFFFTIGLDHWETIAGLAVGGIIAAPLGAIFCKKMPVKPFMILVGALVIALSLFNLYRALH